MWRSLELRVPQRAVKVPTGVDLIARLMIVGRFPAFDLLLAPACRVADEVRAAFEIQCGYTDLRERKLVGTVEQTAVRRCRYGFLLSYARCAYALWVMFFD